MKARLYRARIRQAILFGVLLTLGGLYLRYGLITGNLKTSTTRYLDEFFQQNVEFDRVVYIPFWGVSIDGLKVSSPEGARLFSSENLLLRVSVLPFFVNNKIVITEAVLNKPFIMVSPALKEAVSPEGGEDRAQQLLDGGIDTLLPENVYLEKLITRKGAVIIRDPKAKTKTLESVQRLNLEIDFRKVPLIGLKGNFYLGDKNYAQVIFDGRWDFRQADHELHLKGMTQKIPEWLKRFLPSKDIELRRLETDFSLDVRPDEHAGFVFDVTTKKTDCGVKWGGYRFEGGFSAKLSGAYDPAVQKAMISGGALDIQAGSVQGLPKPMKELKGLKGALFFDQKQVRFRNLQALWQDRPTSLTGKLGFGEGRPFSLEFRQNTNQLAFLGSEVPAAVSEWFNPADVKGDFTVEARLEGSADDFANAKKTAKVSVRNGEWQSARGPKRFSRINGAFSFAGDRIGVQNLFFASDKDHYLLSGFFDTRLDRPSELSLKHQKFGGRCSFVRKESGIEVKSSEVRYGRSVLNLTGAVEQKEGLPFELSGTAVSGLEDLASFKDKWPWLKFLKPTGKANSTLKIKGNLKDRESVELTLAAHVPSVRFLDRLTLKEVDLDLEWSRRGLRLSYGKARLYDGEIRFSGGVRSVQYKRPAAGFSGPAENLRPYFDLKFLSMDVDLSKAVADFPFLDKKFSGTMNLSVAMKGLWDDRQTITGSGDFNIRNGYLFTTPLFKRLKNLAFVTIEGMDNVTFTSADGEFVIDQGIIQSKNTVISSPLIMVEIGGEIGLDQTLALSVDSRFANDVFREADELGGFTPYVVNYAEKKITKYHVTGTLSKPVYQEV